MEPLPQKPPTRIGFGTLCYLANQANPNWRAEYDAAHPIPDWVIQSCENIFRANEAKRKRLMQSSGDFVAGFVPPNYLVDGLIQLRFFYSLTAPTGTGKTCILLLLALLVAQGIELDGKEIELGRVLFFAGENPEDVRMRWVKLCDVFELEPAAIDAFFVPGTPPITAEQVRKRIDAEAETNGPFKLVIIDTAAAYFRGEDENSVQWGHYARALRKFTKLPGAPTVIVSCHPIKNYDKENLLPRGAGNFLNEVDGNLVCLKDPDSDVVTITWHGKFRGPEFDPFSFRIKPGTTEKLKDTRGRLIWTVTAEAISEAEKAQMEQASHNEQNELMGAMSANEGKSLAELAEILGWYTIDGKPSKSKVQRVMNGLRNDRLVEKRRGRYELTKRGEDALSSIAASNI
jgi:hypothetical protein